MKRIYLAFAFIFIALIVRADIRMPRIFGDNMVLQRGAPIPVWGWAAKGEKITLHFNMQSRTTTAGKDGRWIVKLDPEPAGGPYTLTVTGNNKLDFGNVLVGEVWICSGQSNMEMPIAGWGKIDQYQKELREAQFPLIRQIKVPNAVSISPMEDIGAAEWQICSPETAGEFTAAGYFFARTLFQQLGVPIGLINTSWGGTMLETWCSKEALEENEDFKPIIHSMTPSKMDSISKSKNDEAQKRIELLQGPMEKNPKTIEWKNPGFVDESWGNMELPGIWEERGLEEFDGIVWFRKSFELTSEEATQSAILEAGKIDDSDDSYVNGTRVGGMKNQWSENRKYPIPVGILKPGKNTIAIRVEDTGGGGGIYGEDNEMKITIGKKEIPLAGKWAFRIESVSPHSMNLGPNSYPSLLFNAMINPLIPFAIRGAIWYQGEANTGRAYQYRSIFPLMIQDWRKHWNQANFPFYFVQLSSFNASNGNSEKGSGWAELREAQTLTLSLPNTGMAVTTDIGNAMDIHPKNKQDVGKRLAAIAINKLYGLKKEYSGPVFSSAQTRGNKMILTFSHIGSGLMVKDKYGYLKGFEIAGPDQVFHYARAYIEGDNIVVYQEGVSDPQAVRYGWADDASDCNLFNKEGLPASPFRTDHWKEMTTEVKYAIAK